MKMQPNQIGRASNFPTTFVDDLLPSVSVETICILFALFLFLESLGEPLYAQSSTVTVSVTAVDAKNPTITVTYDGKSRSLELAKDIVVEIDGKRSECRSLIPGDDAEVTYDKAQAVVTKIVVKREPLLPAEKLPEGWDEIDQRLIFLMIRLANVEATLEAIEKTTEKNGVRVATVERDAKRADRANEDMDRNAGGPLKWSQFYGTTAEKFFYHPTDRHSSYHTVTVLSQQGYQADKKVGGGVPSSQGLPVHQRPPQFDYIYRSNEKAKTRAAVEAADLKGKLDQLAARRQRLEAEQAGLWVEIAFRAIGHYDLDEKPLYRFEPLMMASDTDSRNKTEMIRTTSEFMALALSIITESEKEQTRTFLKIKPAIEQGRRNLSDSFLRLSIENVDKNSTLGRFLALAKRLEDIAANLTDSYVVAMEGDSAKDRQRKETFRAQLQQSLLGYAQIVLAMDEMSELMKEECNYQPNVGKSIRFVSLANVEAVKTISMPTIPKTTFSSVGEEIAGLITPSMLKRKFAGDATFNPTSGELTISYDFSSKEQLKDFRRLDNRVGFNPMTRQRTLVLGQQHYLEHVVDFDSLTFRANLSILKIPHNKVSPFVRVSSHIGVNCDELNGQRIQLLDAGGMVAEKNFGQAGLERRFIPLTFDVNGAKASVRVFDHAFEKAMKRDRAQNIQLLGNEGGLLVQAMVVSGKPNLEWVKAFLK